MPLRPDIIEKRAVKAGVKASKKRHHVVTEEELLTLKVQVIPALPRIILGISGALLITFCCISWPSADSLIRIIEAVAGGLLLVFGLFGVRRTLGELLDAGASELIGSILEGIVEAVSNIDL